MFVTIFSLIKLVWNLTDSAVNDKTSVSKKIDVFA